jgi:hypothetical protein
MEGSCHILCSFALFFVYCFSYKLKPRVIATAASQVEDELELELELVSELVPCGELPPMMPLFFSMVQQVNGLCGVRYLPSRTLDPR